MVYKKTKLICNFGINDADYTVCPTVDGKTVWCRYYRVWVAMIGRVYGNCKSKKKINYKSCSVHPDWKYFMTFRKWMMENDIGMEGYHMDKDLLSQDVKIYSPDTCVFIPSHINKFLLDRGNDRGEYPIGVHYDKQRDKYQAQCTDRPFRVSGIIARCDTPELAHENWRSYKEMMANRYADELERNHPNNPKYKQAADALRLRYSYKHWYRDYEGELQEDLTGKYPDPTKVVDTIN